MFLLYLSLFICTLLWATNIDQPLTQITVSQIYQIKKKQLPCIFDKIKRKNFKNMKFLKMLFISNIYNNNDLYFCQICPTV